MFRNNKITDHDQEEKQPHRPLSTDDSNGLNANTMKGIYVHEETAHEAAAHGHAATDQYALLLRELVRVC